MSIANNYLNVIIGDNISPKRNSMNQFGNDRVLVYPWIGEGLCNVCREGDENLCDKPRSLGVCTDGGYADYVLVPSYKYLLNIGEDIT